MKHCSTLSHNMKCTSSCESLCPWIHGINTRGANEPLVLSGYTQDTREPMRNLQLPISREAVPT